MTGYRPDNDRISSDTVRIFFARISTLNSYGPATYGYFTPILARKFRRTGKDCLLTKSLYALRTHMNGAEDITPPNYQARRATLEDLPALRSLWHQARLPEDELEKRFTEFQVVPGPDGTILGAVGMQMLKQNGYIHSETFAEPNLATQLRPLLWQRMLTVAKNTGLLRLWTLPTAHFYREQGFTDVDAALKAKVPEEFGNPGADWISLKLKDDAVISAEREFEIFAMAQREESERMMSQAKSLRLFAYGLLFLTLIGIGALAFVYSRIRKRR
jgi:N-acetylglutamate synthase-like GNAT family acetyltransferase